MSGAGYPPSHPSAASPRPAAERVTALLGSRDREQPDPFEAGAAAADRPARRIADAVADRVPVGLRVGVDRRVVAAIAVLALVAVALAVGGWWRARPRSVDAPIVAAPAADAVQARGAHTATAAPGPSAASTPAANGPIVVHVAGKVAHAGVVVLPAGSRVADALRAAGGPLAGADLSALNLARPLVDGEQVPVGVPGAPGPQAPSRAGAATDAVLDLNTATAEQLEELPGIGPVLARHILEQRAELGRFTSVDQLRRVKGVGDRTFADIEPRVRV